MSQQRHMEAEAFAGCMTFSVVSMLGAIAPMVVWFNLAVQDSGSFFGGLAGAGAWIVGIGALASWRFGLSAALGTMGAGLTFALYLYLRLMQTFTAAAGGQIPRPTYPESFGWMIPVLFALVVVIFSVLFAITSESRRNRNTNSNR